MKEYNWRQEREKFQPEFNKRPQESFHSQLPPPVIAASRSSVPWGKILLIVAVLAAIAAGLVLIFRGKTQDSPRSLAGGAEQYKEAVGLVVFRVELQNGKKFEHGVGTAWAIAPNRFVSNAHVARGLQECAGNVVKELAQAMIAEKIKESGAQSVEEFVQKIGEAKAQELAEQAATAARQMIKRVSGEILINGCTRKAYTITSFRIHRDYGVANTNFDPDLAILTVDAESPVYFKVAPDAELYELKSGEPIAFLGFPMENLAQGNVNLDTPIASMQSGIIVAVSGFDLKDAGKQENFLLRHNLPCTGGASGSPIFREDGKVIGVLYAGNIVNQVVKTENGTSQERAPSGAMINFAVRIDLLKGMGKEEKTEDFLKF